MMSLSQIKIAAALSKQITELIEKPSEGRLISLIVLGILLIPNSEEIFNLTADITGPSKLFIFFRILT